MTGGQVTAVRWATVAAYVALGWSLFLGGMTAGEVVAMVCVGAVCLVMVLCADWINAAPRKED